MSERKDFVNLRLATLSRNGGFTRVNVNHAIWDNCQKRGSSGCIHEENGYHCSDCSHPKRDGKTFSQCFTTLGFTPEEVSLVMRTNDAPFGYQVLGAKLVDSKLKQYFSFSCYNGKVTISSILINILDPVED